MSWSSSLCSGSWVEISRIAHEDMSLSIIERKPTYAFIKYVCGTCPTTQKIVAKLVYYA
jgi:hypothetical protein